MTTEIVKVNPEDYHLTAEKGESISSAFLPKISERNAIVQVYEQIIKKEINAETCAEAGTLRKELVKVRTGFAAIHKSQKDMFLQAGRFVDAIKNAETLPVTQMEEVLKGIENHHENLEKERIKKLDDERKLVLSKYDLQEAMMSIDLGVMPEQVWINYLAGVKKTYEDKVEAELKEAEELAALEAAEEVFSERQLMIASYPDFEPNQELSIQTTNDEFVDILDNLKSQKAEHDTEQEKIRLRNVELEKEKKAKEKKDTENTRRQTELINMGLIFNGQEFMYQDINVHWTDILTMTKPVFEKTLIGAKNRLKVIKKEEEQEQAKKDAELEKQQKENDKLKAELKAKEDARIKAEQEEKDRIEAEKQAELDKVKEVELAPDKDKLNKVIVDLQAIKLPEVKNDDAAEIVTAIQSLINKTVAYIELKVEELN